MRFHLDSGTAIKNVAVFTIGLNLALVILGITYYAIPVYSFVWDIHGAILIGTYIWNMLFILVTKRPASGKTRLRRLYSLFSYFYLVFFTFVTFLAMFGNFLLSATFPDRQADYWFGFALIVIGYFGPATFCILLSLLCIKVLKEDASIAQASELSPRRVHLRHRWWVGMKATAYILLAGTSPLIVYFVFASPTSFDSLMFGVFVSQLAGFIGFMYLGLTFMLLRTKDRKKEKAAFITIATLGIVVSVGCFAPLLMTPTMMVNAETNFTAAFGSDWRSRIDATANARFMQTPFSLPEYFLNHDITAYQVKRDILFYTGTSGVDAGITLYFDVYLPPKGVTGLPGQNSTLVRIHGGGWQIGDKARGNMVQMNRYFASQGYIVFDIQNGMRSGGWELPIITPPNVLAPNITTDDMIRHVGIFFKYIIANQTKYGCNLSSTFISGGSAGGQLTCAAALAIVSGNYTPWFGSDAMIKGLIPFYPGNGLAPPPLNGTIHELWEPTEMVGATSPPCLIFQGTNDLPHIVNASIRFKAAYDAHGRQCAIIWAPLAGHGNDLHFAGHYNRVFLYYMERFMYMFK
nr:alpha/beta hydrolase [Candidatus Sigynarchaeota archaeon]